MVRQIRALCSRAIVLRLAINIPLSRGATLQEMFSGIEGEKVDAGPDSCRRAFLSSRSSAWTKDWKTRRKIMLTTYVAYDNKKPLYERAFTVLTRTKFQCVRASRRSQRRLASRVVPDALRFAREIFSNNCISCRNHRTLSLTLSTSSYLNILRYIFILSYFFVHFICVYFCVHTHKRECILPEQNKLLLLLLPVYARSNVDLIELIKNARRKVVLKHYNYNYSVTI